MYVLSYFPFGFEGRMWDLIASVPDHCLSFYFKCHMDIDRNHYKANFINIAKRTMFLRQKTVKQVFQNGLNEKI